MSRTAWNKLSKNNQKEIFKKKSKRTLTNIRDPWTLLVIYPWIIIVRDIWRLRLRDAQTVNLNHKWTVWGNLKRTVWGNHQWRVCKWRVQVNPKWRI